MQKSTLILVFIQEIVGKELLPFWPFLLILFLSGVILYSRSLNHSNWTLLFKSTYSSRSVAYLIREENALENSFYGVLVFIFFLSFALFWYNVQLYQGLFPSFTNTVLFYPLILFLLFGLYIAKIAILYLLQFIFEQRELFDEYIIVFMNINIVLGIWLIPLNLLISYGIVFPKSILLSLAGFLFVGSLIFVQIRMFKIGLRNNLKWYNIILYLCTLEIMPIILILTLIRGAEINLSLE